MASKKTENDTGIENTDETATIDMTKRDDKTEETAPIEGSAAGTEGKWQEPGEETEKAPEESPRRTARKSTKRAPKKAEGPASEEVTEKEPAKATKPDGQVEANDMLLPIMPMSNILTEAAVERVMGYSYDDGNDPVAKSVRAKRAIRDGIGWFAPEFVTKGLSVASSKAIFHMSGIESRLADLSEIRKSGHTPEDVRSLGISLVRRFAKMLREISDITSDGLMDDVAKVLARSVAWYESGYYSMASMLGHEAVWETSLRMRREFDSAWGWLYEHIFLLDNMPSEPSFRRAFWDASARSLDVRGGLDGVIRDMGSIAQGEPTMADLHAMPYAELERLSEILQEFAETATSWPEVYPGRPQLAKADDDWDESQYWDLLGGIRTNNAQGSNERITEVDADGNEQVFYRTKTNSQMGLAFSAWTQDCHEAATIIGYWGQDNAKDEEYLLVREIMTPEQRDEIDRRRKEAWDWLGHYAFCMGL